MVKRLASLIVNYVQLFCRMTNGRKTRDTSKVPKRKVKSDDPAAAWQYGSGP